MSAFSDAVLALTPTAYWRLGESAGTDVVDEKALQNGVYVNTPTLGVAGYADATGVTFVAANTERVTVVDNAAWDMGTGDFSLMCALQLATWPGTEHRGVIVRGSGFGVGDWRLALNQFTANFFLFVMDTATDQNLDAGVTMAGTGWHLVGLSVDRDARATLYVDGVERMYVDVSPDVALNMAGVNGVTIASAGAFNYLDGSMGEVAIWKGTLITPGQWAALHDVAVPATLARPYQKAVGAWAEYTADGAVTIPGTPAAGDRMFLFATWKAFGTTASVVGWTAIGAEFTDGAVASAANLGSVKVQCWYRDWVAGDGNPTVDWSVSPTIGRAVIALWGKPTDSTWMDPLTATAAWPVTAATQTVAASGSTVVPSGAAVMALIGLRDDSALFTRAGTTGIDVASGLTWDGNYQESPLVHGSSATGDDSAADLGWRMVGAGGTATLRVTATISAVETGAVKWVAQGVSRRVPAESPYTHLLAQ